MPTMFRLLPSPHIFLHIDYIILLCLHLQLHFLELDCGSDWKGAEGDFGTFCYKNTNLKATFAAASEHCRKLDGNMFSVLNAYENLYLQNHILSDTVESQSWIGYQDKGQFLIYDLFEG